MVPNAYHVNIPESELELRFVRSSGPGGQNVNKVATAVQLRFDIAHSPSLSDDVRQRLLRLAGRRVNAGGVLVIDARRYRTQERNRRDALDRLQALLLRAALKPKPRHKTRPSRASRERTLAAKQRRAETKRRRAPLRDIGD
jgi:ribosome-associated protein